jgi:hypothetical protein
MLSHQRGKKNKKQKKNTTKYPKFKCNTVSVSLSACSFSCCCLIKGREKEKEKKKGSGDSSVNGYLRLRFTCPLFSKLLLEALLIADLRSELNSHLALQTLFI